MDILALFLIICLIVLVARAARRILPEEAINLIKKLLPYIKAFTLAVFGVDLQIALEKVSEK